MVNCFVAKWNIVRFFSFQPQSACHSVKTKKDQEDFFRAHTWSCYLRQALTLHWIVPTTLETCCSDIFAHDLEWLVISFRKVQCSMYLVSFINVLKFGIICIHISKMKFLFLYLIFFVRSGQWYCFPSILKVNVSIACF